MILAGFHIRLEILTPRGQVSEVKVNNQLFKLAFILILFLKKFIWAFI